MRRAYETEKPQNIMLHTIRLGANLWRQYAIRFDPEQNEVAVRIGPIVDTSQAPIPGSEPPFPSSPPTGGERGERVIPPNGGERGGERGTGQSRHTNGAHLRRGEPHRHLQRAIVQVRAAGRPTAHPLPRLAPLLIPQPDAGGGSRSGGRPPLWKMGRDCGGPRLRRPHPGGPTGLYGQQSVLPLHEETVHRTATAPLRRRGAQLPHCLDFRRADSLQPGPFLGPAAAEPVVVPGTGGGAAGGSVGRAVPVATTAREAGGERVTPAAGHRVGDGGSGGIVRWLVRGLAHWPEFRTNTIPSREPDEPRLCHRPSFPISSGHRRVDRHRGGSAYDAESGAIRLAFSMIRSSVDWSASISLV